MTMAPTLPASSHALATQSLPARSIADLGTAMCEGIALRLYSADGLRHVDIRGDQLLEAVNDCAILANACDVDFITLGDLLDQTEHSLRHPSPFARAYVRDRIRDPYWRRQARRIVGLAPDGSGTREALRYYLATQQAHDVLS